MAPVPPREEFPDKPVTPPRYKVKKPTAPLQGDSTHVPVKRKEPHSHGEPPQRPVPPPPTAKPSVFKKPSVQSAKGDDVIIFIDKDLPGKTPVSATTSYENLPEKPRHSPNFIKMENIKNPIAVVSLQNEMSQNDASVFNSPGDAKIPKAKKLVGSRPSVPSKPTSPTQNTVSPTPPPPTAARKVNERRISSSDKPTSPSALKPSKPLPKLNRTDVSADEPSVPMARPRPLVSKDIPSGPVKSPDKKNVISQPAIVTKLDNARPSSYAVKLAPTPTKALPSLTEDSLRTKKPSPPTKPNPKMINKDSDKGPQVTVTKSSPHTAVGIKDPTSSVEIVASDIQPDMAQNTETKESSAADARSAPLSPNRANKPVKKDFPRVVEEKLKYPEAALRTSESTKAPSLNNSQCESTKAILAKSISAADKPSVPLKPSATCVSKEKKRPGNAEPPMQPSLASPPSTAKSSKDLARAYCSSTMPTSPQTAPQNPTPASKPSSTHLSGNAIKISDDTAASSPKEIKPVPAQRVFRSNKVNETSAMAYASKEETEQTAMNNAPMPTPRSVVSSACATQDMVAKTKPARPSSPPTQGLAKHGKPDRPPPPSSVQSPKIPSPTSRAKDRSKLRTVVRSFSKSSNKELNLVVGEVLFELATENGRCYGLLENGKEGWYPADHVRAVDTSS